MRKYYLLVAEMCRQDIVESERFYALISCWIKDPVEPGKIFPILAKDTPVTTSDDDDVDEDLSFQAVTSSLSLYRR